MKFENTTVIGIENALIGMRLPMCKDCTDARTKSDSFSERFNGNYIIGEKDLDLAKKLINADEKNSYGQPNSKFLRMIYVQVAITAPLYWWKEMDTYKVGTVANSTSTMHKLASNPITKECFEMDDYDKEFGKIESVDNLRLPTPINRIWENLIDDLEGLRFMYNETKDKRYWKELIRLLPESWLQTRMFDCNYATLRQIYRQRKGHKLTEWLSFCDWVKTLPYANELIIGE